MKKEERKMKKARSKKLFLLTFFFFTFSLLICSCHNPSVADKSAVVKIPPGMGAFSLGISGISRTVLPATPTLAYFDKLELVFTAEGGGAAAHTETINSYTGSSTLPAVFLQPGEYSLAVNAYKNDALAARGTLDSIEIELGENTADTVTLKAIFEGEIKGKFSWDITIPSLVTSAKMTITSLRDGSTVVPETSLPIISGTKVTGYNDPYPGPYNVILTFNQTAGGPSLVWYEIVHIYSTLESKFEKEFFDGHFLDTNYTVTFESNGGTNIPAIQSVEHGEIVTPPADPTKKVDADAYLYLGTPPATHGFTFGGWYTDNGTFDDEWDPDDPVIGSITVYAKWTGAIDVSGYGGATAHDAERAIAYVVAKAAAGDSYTLCMFATASVAPQTLNSNNTNLTIKGIGGMRNISLLTAGSLFTVGHSTAGGPDIELTIGENITLAGYGSNEAALVKVQNGAKFTMLSGSKITGNTFINGNWDKQTIAVLVTDSGSTFTMNGGEITGNNSSTDEGKVVLVENDGIFNMKGGSISGNTAPFGDVHITNYAGSFTLSGEAAIEKLVLYTTSQTSICSVTVGSGWSGSVQSFNLMSNQYPASIDSVISWWENKEVLKAAPGYVLQASDVVKFTLGNFTSSLSPSTVTQSIANTHSLANAGASIGKLIEWDLQTEVNKYAYAASAMTINVPKNLTLTNSTNINVPAPANTTATLTITSASGGPYTITRGQQDSTANGLFMVNSGAKLIFQAITIDGDKVTHTGNTASLVRVDTGGEFTLNNGAVLKNNRATNGGGVFVSTGTFTMSGGEISGNDANGSTSSSGGGVYNRGTFNMSGSAVISGNTANGNTATSGGGGVFDSGGIFNMSGGSISGNILTGANANGGGLYISVGTFRVGGAAKILGNTKTSAGSNNVYLSGSTFIILGNGTPATENVPSPGTGMEIHVKSTANADGVIVESGANSTIAGYFHADDTNKEVLHEGGSLVLAVKPGTFSIITLTIEDIVEGAPSIAAVTLSKTGAGGNPAIQTITIPGDPDDYDSIQWKAAGVGDYAGEYVTGDGNSFDLKANNEKYSTLGSHTLMLTVIKDGNPYMVNIRFTIVP